MYYIRLNGAFVNVYYWAEDGPGGYWTRDPDKASMFATTDEANDVAELEIPKYDDYTICRRY